MRTILVVEDSPTQAEHLRFLLQDAGYRVLLAENGLAALNRMQLYLPDLILSDVLMPEMDGFDFCRRVKSTPRTKHIPFVLLTALNTVNDVIFGLECGADNFLTKPFDQKRLLERVERIMANAELVGGSQAGAVLASSRGNYPISVTADRRQIAELMVAVIDEMSQLNERLAESRRIAMTCQNELLLVERIRKALDGDGLSLSLMGQPVIRLDGNDTLYDELFLRIVDESGVPLNAAAFLPTAAKSGIITTLDHWVVRQAVQLVRDQPANGKPPAVGINLAHRSLYDCDMVAFIRAEIAAAGVDAARFTFEISRIGALDRLEPAMLFMATLREMGCRVALDDCGAGTAQPAYLRQFPADCLKIDADLIRDLPESQEARQTVRRLVESATALGQIAVAKNVEDPKTLQLVRELGVECAQGYQIGRPRPMLRQAGRCPEL